MTTRDQDADAEAAVNFQRRHLDRIDRTIVALIAERARLLGTDQPEHIASETIADATLKGRARE